MLEPHGKVGRRVASLCVTAVVAGSLTLAAFGGAAQGAVGPCRSDPVVALTNLKVLDLSATINDSSSDLKSVSYVMHLPAGVRPLLVIPTDGLVGQVEHFSYVNDQRSGSYSVTTEAYTGSTVSVQSHALMLLLGGILNSANASGSSNQPIQMHL